MPYSVVNRVKYAYINKLAVRQKNDPRNKSGYFLRNVF